MTMWGFSSRKDQDGSNASNDASSDPKQSPSKRSRRRMGRGRGNNDDNKKGNDNSKGAKSGPFSRGGKQQAQQQTQAQAKPGNNPEQALKTSTFMNQKETSHYDQQQQDINVDATDSQGIEILLDYNAVRNKTLDKYNEDTTKNPGQHHSRRSMSNRTKDKRRSLPPEPHRPANQQPSAALPLGEMPKPVVSLEKDILAQRTKIHRAQFSVFFPVSANDPHDPSARPDQRKPHHRVPLGGRQPAINLSYNEVLQMLQQANPVDEVSVVRMELKKTQAEMDALESDKKALEQKLLIKQQHSQSGEHVKQSKLAEGIDWDIHRLLGSNRKLASMERAELEQKRGRCITTYLHNPRSADAFMNKCCGAKVQPPKTTRRRAPALTLTPQNCKAGGAGATIRHLSLLSSGSSFFVSRDNGKSYSWGQLPSRLLQRMKSQNMDPVKVCGDLLYLSTGPNGYYYAEFRSGACWWGCAGEDKEFYEILQKWNVYRVVFGSTMSHTIVDANNRTREIITNSWIILGRDGRAAWKNLPSRLHQTLERRVASSAAPAEVALGSGNSYYIRFLDGTMDFCLPAEVASVCEHIQHGGGSITDMALNPEVSHEFMLRHTEVPS